MGLAASQVRFLQLTDRDHDISRMLQGLASQKTSLARDMKGVTRDYQKALSAKVMKWSNNSGVTYSDLTYSTLMKPNELNRKSPVMVSDLSGKIVLDKKYAKYAELLDSNGGNWSGDIKNQILAELTGITVEDIDGFYNAVDDANAAAEKFEELRNDFDKWKYIQTEKNKGGTRFLSTEDYAKLIGTINGTDISALYKKADKGNYAVSTDSDIQILGEGIKNSLSKYFIDDETYIGVKDKTAFENACDTFVQHYTSLINNTSKNADEIRTNYGVNGRAGNWTINIADAFKFIMSAYSENGSVGQKSIDGSNTFPLRDMDSENWQRWYEELKIRKEVMDEARVEYDKYVDIANKAMTADQETSLDYYDLLFQSIADNGWVCDEQIGDAEYLNQMFQNNSFTITTISKNDCYDETAASSLKNVQFYYDTSLAMDYENIFMVSDSDVREQALVDYEYKKSIISEKESRIDQRMKNLETEKSAIKKMMESIKKISDENIERTMNLWG